MNIVRRLSQSIVRIKNYRGIFSISNRCVIGIKLPQLFIKRFVQITISNSVMYHVKVTVDDDLRKACEEGEKAILKLMSQLEDLVKSTSKEYRSCLHKQIELIKKATNINSDIWEELPEYRTLASKLNAELNEYLVLIRTIGEMAFDQSLISSFINESGISTIIKKYEDLEKILLKEFEANKQLELELLSVNVTNIVSISV